MRHTLNAIDPLPAFLSHGLSFELQDSEPAYEPCERHKRLPSYREVCEARREAKWLREVMQYRARNGSTSWGSKQLYFHLDTFNGNCNPEITEADCRKRKSAPADVESEQAAFERWAGLECPSGDVESVKYQWARSDARAEWLESQQESPAEQPKQATDAPKFKVGDGVRAIKSVGDVVVGDEFTVVRLEVVGLSTHVHVKGRVHVYLFEHHLELLPAEPAPQEPQADADGWIEWKGGKCPIPKETPVVVRLRGGSEYDGETAADWIWAHGDMDGDIVAYRIVA
jgi:hypothetical protein